MTYLDALQATLAAEHAAVYVYGVLGGQTSRTAQPALFAQIEEAYAAHRARRDTLGAQVRGLGAEPVASLPAYEVPARLGTVRAVEREALRLERACAQTYAYAVASATGADRRWAVLALNETAVRELAFRGAPEMLPGSDEYADR